VQNQSLELAVHTDLKRLYLDLYQSIEALKRGNPFWEMAGKDLTAYRIERRLEQKFEELAEQKSQAFLRMHEQLFEAEIARQKSHYEAAILHEKLQKKIDIAFAAQAQILGKALNEESFAALPEDAQAEFIIRLVERVMDEIFASTSPNINNATLPDPYSRQNTIIINPDEF
jgi:hypothetical protein